MQALGRSEALHWVVSSIGAFDCIKIKLIKLVRKIGNSVAIG